MPDDQLPVAIATVAATLAAHIEQCKSDKADIKAQQEDIKSALAAQNSVWDGMHKENQIRFRRLEVIYYFATAAVAVVMFLGTEMGQRILKLLFHAPGGS